MRAEDAINLLSFQNKIAARPVIKLIESAMANAAHNHQLDKSSLVIVKAFVDGGPMQYRYVPHAFGRATPIRKRTAHITVVLAGKQVAQKEKANDMSTDSKEIETSEETVSVPKAKTAKAKKLVAKKKTTKAKSTVKK
jgi:large subunit ribosomal protein L22